MACGDLIVVLIIVVIFCNLVGGVSSLIKSDTPHLEETAQLQTPISTHHRLAGRN